MSGPLPWEKVSGATELRPWEKAKEPEQISPMDVPALVAKGAGEGVYDVVTSPYALLGKDTKSLKKDIFKSAPTARGPIGRGAEGVGEGIGATIPGLGEGAIIEQLGAKFGAPMLKTLGKFMRQDPVQQVAGGAVAGGVDEATGMPGTGAAAAAAAPFGAAGIRKAITPNLGHLTGDQTRLVQLAKGMGIPLTAADLTGNRTLQQAEAVLHALPGASGVMQENLKAQREAYNREVLKIAGINDKYAKPDVLNTAHRALGTELDNLAAQSSGVLDRQFATEVDRVIYDQGRRLSTDVSPTFKSYVDDLQPYLTAARLGLPTKTLSGTEYDEIRKGISQRARKTQDPFLKDALTGLMEALDGAMERSSPPTLRAQWGDARKRYAAISIIEDAMAGGRQEDREIGNIPFSGLKAVTSNKDRRAYSRGEGMFNDISRIGEFLAPKVPTSGTAERSNMTKTLKGAGLGSALTYGLTTGDLITPGVALATPYGLSKAYTSDAVTKWLARQNSGPTKGLLRMLEESARGAAPQVAREAND